jgi:rsbT co-antagonist protein RsbR
MTVATAEEAPTRRLFGPDEEEEEGHSGMPGPQPGKASEEKTGDDGELLSALVAHLRDNRSQLRQQWVDRISDAHLLSAMTAREVFNEVTSVYDNYVAVLETRSVDKLRHYARDLSERIIPRGVETHEVVGIVLLHRDVLARSLFEKYRHDFDLLHKVLDTYEPAANRVANTVAVSFVEERERIISQQQDAIRELSTPVMQVRERLLILPIIGPLDNARAHQLTEQLLHAIRAHRAKVVVLDITGVLDVDEAVADHLTSTIDASHLMGAEIITTGLSPAIAQTLVAIGADISKLNTAGDLQSGLEQAEHQLGLALIRTDSATE